jgi:hypothetical protein
MSGRRNRVTLGALILAAALLAVFTVVYVAFLH